MGKRTRRTSIGVSALLGTLFVLAVSRSRRRGTTPLGSSTVASADALAASTPHYPRWFTLLTETLDQTIGWDKLPLPMALAVLEGIRMRMRERNLYDTATSAFTRALEQQVPPAEPRFLVARTDDGTYNDLDQPAMGANGARFGRNVPIADTFPDAEPAILTPNPRTVSRELMTRDTFLPATTLNLLAATWLQFMVHDWFSHGKNAKRHKWLIPLAEDDPFPQHPMEILRTRRDPHSPHESGLPPTYVNVVTHWWDASQLYGSDAATVARGRLGIDGKLRVEQDGLLPLDPLTGTDVAGVEGNWWLGLSLMHTLFALEHNAVCDQLRAAYPQWSDNDIFDHARLVIAALLAKIHTVEWTPAILGNPALQIGMRANWWGVQGERLTNLFGRFSANEVVSGIPGGPKDHFGVPYSLTEEFVAVYRMHPLIPDDFRFRALQDNHLIEAKTFPEVADLAARGVMERIPRTDLFYSFGTSHPGAITLHNFPRSLQERTEPDGSIIDLAAIDIMRSRERGVPRYNEFRKLVHRPPVQRFEALTDNREWAEQIRQVYNNDIDRVDLTVGLFAEPLPPGFGFSDTAFRIFTVMASRRLNSDRFFTTDFNEQTYTKVGMDWIRDNGLASVLLRHFPALAPALRNLKNPFAPWAVTPTPTRTDYHPRPAPVPDAYPVPGAGRGGVPE